MKIYTDENDLKLVQTVASASTLISSITGEIKEYVASKFPRGFFKSIYIDTAETIHAQNRNKRHNETLNKIQFPNIAITPEISLDDPIGGMEKSMHISSPNLYIKRDMKRNYQKLVIDPDEKFSIYYTSDYITTNFNFRITTNKYIQNIDIAYYIKSRFQINMFQYLNGRYLNTEIPKTYIKIIAEILGLDVNDPDEMDELRLHLISTGTSADIIRKKVNAMTGKIGFFVNEKKNFLINVLDLDAPPSINRDRMSEGEYTINFKVQVSAWLPNSFIMSLNREKLLGLDQEILQNTLTNDFSEQDSGFYSLSLSDALLNRKDSIKFQTSSGETVIGQEIFHTVFTYDINRDIDTLNIGQYLKKDIKRVHAYMIDKNLDVRDLINIKLYNRIGELTNVEIDYDTLTISLNESIDGQDISMAIYADRVLFESLLKAIANDEFFFANNALATLWLNDYLGVANVDEIEDVKVAVYSFPKEKDYYGKAVMINGEWRSTVLRVFTAYGVGFVGLVEANDPRATNYKIVIGIDKDNEPIIRALEKIN